MRQQAKTQQGAKRKCEQILKFIIPFENQTKLVLGRHYTRKPVDLQGLFWNRPTKDSVMEQITVERVKISKNVEN